MNYLIESINDFRYANGRSSVTWETWISDKCFYHSREMALSSFFYHAPVHFLDGLLEAVCTSHIWLNKRDQIRYMVYELLGKSPSHRDLLLNSSILGGCDFIHNNCMYITVRGR